MDALPYGFGWLPDIPDIRDYRYAAAPQVLAALPPSVDLRPKCPPVVDQRNLGSCVANAIGSAHRYAQHVQRAHHPITASRLFLYYNARVMIGTVASDSGAYIRDGMKSVAQQGVCSEAKWPYTLAKFTRKPPASCYTSALTHQGLLYQRVSQSLTQLQGCLAAGFPFVFGFAVYESFVSSAVANTGIVPMPSPREQLLGGHAVLAVGYDDTQQRFLVRNSWGVAWGEKGDFTMPYAYLVDGDLSNDFWMLTLVETT